MSESKLTYITGDLFSAPKGAILVQACNTNGVWGAGIALAFQQRYPDLFVRYRAHCREHNGEDLVGTCLLLQGENHSVACLFTSRSYGRRKDSPQEILAATKSALEDLMRQNEASNELHACRFNSGKFAVPWEATEDVLKELGVKITIYTPEERTINKDSARIMSTLLAQAQQEGLVLRYPDNIPPQRELTHEHATNLLVRGAQLAHNVPFTWAYIDKPHDGQLFLLYLQPTASFPNDGIRFQDTEIKYNLNAGLQRELEVQELKFGFIPGSQEPNASRVRRRYRLVKGGLPQLVLVHYTRGPPTIIQPNFMNQAVRNYPLRNPNEPSIYVFGDKAGQKVFPPGQPHGMPGGGGGVGGVGVGGGPGPGPGPMPPATIGMNMNFSQQQAMVAQQASTMEALERRREREKERERLAARERAAAAAGPRPPVARVEEDDSGDEIETISTRTLALARYKRNHEWMNEVFTQAAFGKQLGKEPPKPPYSIFDKAELDEKAARLQAEVDALQASAAQRRAEKIRQSQSNEGDFLMSS